ncbi:1,4-alpha-glucan branching protein GlgB [Siphonobacter sp. SORGH_AS_0500]|uniref:1,4-alpha-glucan branching protein GlgB n=1 Tax=Siphonobacter sp. SORGH_AS_0500 TaxID=1864824 RepID=UPI000CA6AE97|nr:1,4-alpha-glucan branching protein GlgB [Siphonobacter sp. SORGH_AS_0500]MDR6194240.1 1,4-alpha-glucan branching enzyme [Siphonobacter sp. SORGH_AS_0500]PKK37029.1 1,4-alpha-glucan branching enzyme [Siphonobacter sp. SORGH_AS_0500]
MAKSNTKPQPQEIIPEVSAEIPVTFKPVEPISRFTEFDIHLFASGKHFKLYEKFGSHVMEHEGVTGTYFAVWAPNARYVSVIGNFNYWDRGTHRLYVRLDSSGIWEGWIPNVGNGEVYKYFIVANSGEEMEKGDPYALRWEEPPSTASVVWDTWYEWKDYQWLEERGEKNKLNAPMSVYEVHLGSWLRDPNEPDRRLRIPEFADRLVEHVKECGFTHVEFMPIMQHPYEPSWGYQITGYYAANTKYGSPQEIMMLIEKLHQNGIGVLLDWVPSHFPGDLTGLYRFDGSHLYEHADPRQGYHPDWKSYIFNYGRNEIRSFLLSNAIFWLDRYHVDGLRVDAVASMLYLDYSRNAGEWIPNVFGGRENLEAISLFKELNTIIYREYPDTQTIAEESTAFPGVSRPTYTGGLGFGMKWMMGWMNDTLKYFEKDPAYRKYHQDQFTFSTVYGFTENFMLPLSHDEVVYGKKALVSKMPGDEWQRFANLRLLYTYMFTHSGTKLIFMGGEFGQTSEWNFTQSLDWHLLQYAPHQGMKNLISEINALYKKEPALYEKSFTADGFEWIDTQDKENTVVVYSRKGNSPKETLVIALNMTPVPRTNYRVGVPMQGMYTEIFNSDSVRFWGTGQYENGTYMAEEIAWQGKAYSIGINIPPLSGVVFKVW